MAPIDLKLKFIISSVQSLSHVLLFVTHGLQHARLSCPSPSPGACSNSCPWQSVMLPNYLILSRPLLLLSSIFPCIRVFSKELALCFGGQNIGASYWAAKWFSCSLDALCKGISHAVQGWVTGFKDFNTQRVGHDLTTKQQQYSTIPLKGEVVWLPSDGTRRHGIRIRC